MSCEYTLGMDNNFFGCGTFELSNFDESGIVVDNEQVGVLSPFKLLQLFAMGVWVGMLESVAPIFDSGLGSTLSNTSQAPLAALRDLATR